MLSPGIRSLASASSILLLLPSLLPAQSSGADRVEARAIFAELIGINTTQEHGSTTPAAEAVARRLRAAGFPPEDIHVVGPDSTHMNLVARLRGTGVRKPILLLAHLDVVEALPQDWSLDPFTLTERDGYLYGRGTSDIKDEAAIFTAVLLGLRREGYVPDRDIILALTAGEESGVANGVQWLLANRRELIDAVYCVNGDGGDVLARSGKVYSRNVQASEKVYMDLDLTVRNTGGHSSMPVRNNTIYRLSAGLTRLAAHDFPIRLNEVTRGFFERGSASAPAAVAADMRRVARRADPAAIRRLTSQSPFFNAQLRTTCVATMLEGGHAPNALPQTARANVNCRMLPDEIPDTVIATIRRVVADTAIQVTVRTAPVASPLSPLIPEVLEPVERITREMWPGAAVVPSMETGATDGLYLRNAGMPVYGLSGVPLDEDDIRAHGRDERIRSSAYDEGLLFTDRLVRALTSGSGP